ncbi:MAG: ion transporter [Rhizobiaceae bacterium]
MKKPQTWRHWAYHNLDMAAWHRAGISPLNRIIVVLILAAVCSAVLETEPTIYDGNQTLFRLVQLAFAGVFLFEYIVRVWASAENKEHESEWQARMRYASSLPAVIDLVALVTLFLALYGGEGALLRLFRLIRIFMLARLGRYSTAFHAIGSAIKARRYELIASLTIGMMLLLVSSTLLFLVEGPYQPEDFGSIPRAMWWSVATLTTVGYGDVHPITPIGKILAGITAVTGIGVIAMPTGILAAAFSNAIQRQHEERERHRAEHSHSPVEVRTGQKPPAGGIAHGRDESG